MTIISKNLKRLFREHGYSKAEISRICKREGSPISAAGVHHWVEEVNPLIPKTDKLIILAGLFRTTVDELLTNPNCKAGEAVSSMLNFHVLEKVIALLENHKILSYAYDNGSHYEKAYMFGLLYSLCEDIETERLDGDELLGMMDLSIGIKNATKPAKKSATKSIKKRSRRNTN